MSIFKNYDPFASRIKASQDKINQFPEIRGLITSSSSIKNKNKNYQMELKFKSVSEQGWLTFEYDKRPFEVMEVFNSYNISSTWDRVGVIKVDFIKDFINDLKKKVDLKLVNFEPVYKPFWNIRRGDKAIIIEWNGITNINARYKRLDRVVDDKYYDIFKIPGLLRSNRYYTIPLSEGWRLYEIHPELETDLCKWESVELIKEVQEEFNKRLKVIKIHTAEDSDVDVTFDDPNFKSRGHQRVAFEFQDLVGHKTIIAYGTGTGKTSIGIAGPLRLGTKKNLVLCPGALRLNWARHIKNLTGIEPLILAGRVPTKYDIKYLMLNQPEWVIINYDILRTKIDIEKEAKKNNRLYDATFSDDPYFPWVEALNLYKFDYIIVDESHYARNPAANQSQALRQLESEYKTALSGTPIVNRPGELWTILNWLHPEQFPYYETFLNQYGYGRAIGDEQAKELRSLLETIMIKRMRKDISKNLPPINRISETYDMSPKAAKIYNRILQGIYQELAEFDHLGVGGEEKKFKSILPKLNAMIKVCAADKVRVTVERAQELADGLEDEPWNKVLIFTHFKGTCNTIARLLGHEALSFVERTRTGFKTANMEERMALVKQFQEDPKLKYLVVTDGSAAEGLDITAAGVVLFNDLFWTPAKHTQCEGRPFYREVDMHGGDSYYLQFKDSIEEWIVELHGIKENTIDKIIEGKGMGHSVTNEIISRLREAWKKSVSK